MVLRKETSDLFVLFFNGETQPLPAAILVFNQDIYMKNERGICRKPIQTSRHYFRAVLAHLSFLEICPRVLFSFPSRQQLCSEHHRLRPCRPEKEALPLFSSVFSQTLNVCNLFFKYPCHSKEESIHEKIGKTLR